MKKDITDVLSWMLEIEKIKKPISGGIIYQSLLRKVIMRPSNTDSESPLNHLTASASSPTPATSKQSEESRLAATKKWLETINANMMRMSEDDGYRREIAKNLS